MMMMVIHFISGTSPLLCVSFTSCSILWPKRCTCQDDHDLRRCFLFFFDFVDTDACQPAMFNFIIHTQSCIRRTQSNSMCSHSTVLDASCHCSVQQDLPYHASIHPSLGL